MIFFQKGIVASMQQNFRRVAIADRSVLAHNVYQMLLKPLGLSLFPFKTLKDLKENFNRKWNLNLLLINSNTFGHYFEKHMEWFLNENNIQKTPKFFLCESGEKKILSGLKKLPNSFILAKPFYPSEFEKKVAHLFKGVK